MMKYCRLFYIFLLFVYSPAMATTPPQCLATDHICMTKYLAGLATQIEKDDWRDQTYRELAKSMAANGRSLEAIPYIAKITNPDTKALTIRGIGMEAAMVGKVPENLFKELRVEAEKIEHPPSYGIALTYIAMAQAFAGEDAGAKLTASQMQNEDLRNKAYGETAEIQAEKGKFGLAMESISYIVSTSFKNKAYKTVSRIFAEDRKYQEAFDTAINISNPVMQAEAVQYILDTQQKEQEKARSE